MTIASLPPPTFGISDKNFQLSYAGQTATSPLQNTPGGVSVSSYVDDGQGDSTAVAFSVNNSGSENFTEAVGNPGSDTLTTARASTNGSTVTQTIFDVLTGAVTTIKIKSDGNGQFTYSETDDSQNGISSYSSNGQATPEQDANAASLVKNLFT